MSAKIAWLVALLAIALGVGAALAQVPPVLDRLHRADGAHVLPDRFLREWDPITVLFDQDRGPQAGGPEDVPGRIVALDPAPPGAWTWLGPRTLQFRPAEPWTPLRRETITVGDIAKRLVPLLPMPVAAGPDDSPAGIGGLDSVALSFSTPVDEAALARLTTIELAPQPGVAESGHQTLTAADFSITAQERGSRSDRQTYLFALRHPVPDGRIATLHLRLSDEPGLDDPTFTLALHSAVPFTVTSVSCGGSYTGRSSDDVLQCQPDAASRGPRTLDLAFTAPPASLDIVAARQALRLTPPADDLAVGISGSVLSISGKFAAGTDLYAGRLRRHLARRRRTHARGSDQ